MEAPGAVDFARVSVLLDMLLLGCPGWWEAESQSLAAMVGRNRGRLEAGSLDL